MKNTLAQRALADYHMAALESHFKGPTGLVLAGEDPLPAAKVIGEFAKEHEKPTVRPAWWTGRPSSPAYVKRLGEIPSREVLLAQFAGSLNGLLYHMVGALEPLREQRSGRDGRS